MPFKYILSDAVFCGNALLTINQTTPYNAVYGRVPKILPGINCPDAEIKVKCQVPVSYDTLTDSGKYQCNQWSKAQQLPGMVEH